MSELYSDHRWASWLLRSPLARRLGIAIATGAATAAVIATALALATLISGRATSGLTPLVIPAVANLVVGQLWMIALQRAHHQLPAKRESRLSKVRSWFGGDLPLAVAIAIATVAFAGMLMATTAVPALSDSSTAGQDEAAWQRMFTGMLAFFFAVHAGVALGAVRSSRQTKTISTQDPPTTPS